MVWCSAAILMTNFESPRTTICLSQFERNGFRKLSTRDKDLNKRTLVASLIGLLVYALQSVAYGYEMLSAAYMQVNNYYRFLNTIFSLIFFICQSKGTKLTCFSASVCNTRVDVETLRNLPFPGFPMSGSHLLHFLPPRPPFQHHPPLAHCRQGEWTSSPV